MGDQGTFGIVFADIAGSTRLYEVLGDSAALAVINACMSTMGESVATHRGEVVKTIGDEVMAAFPDPDATFAAAIDMRRRILSMPPIDANGRQIRVRVRIGLHFGPALRVKNDYFGDVVNIAARMVELASASQILTTGELLSLLPPNLRSLATEFAEIEVKGRQAPVRIARVADDTETVEHTQVRFGESAPPAMVEARVTLVFNGQRWTLPIGTRSIVLGREAGCDLLLTGALASRRHATIEIRRDKAVLIDHSSNGTWLLVGDDRPMRLQREEFGLMREGRIVFGNLDAPDADVLDFSVG